VLALAVAAECGKGLTASVKDPTPQGSQSLAHIPRTLEAEDEVLKQTLRSHVCKEMLEISEVLRESQPT
jgi:hypothetical protein